MKIINLLFLSLFITGCATKELPCNPIVAIEYVEVKVPVLQELKRRQRPQSEDYASIPEYVKALTAYTKILEVTIDGTRKHQ